ncbi:MAG TPA: hypothetical protein PLP34_06490, partial [Chitinophagaceae bacterium]|nr:hypothetical protein [Chitinophagaceae bacterium]
MFSQPNVHLVINHLPVFFPLAALLLLLLSLLLRNEVVLRCAYFLLICTALGAFVVSVSGERAEEAVEHLQGFDKHLIHEHEEWSERFSLFSYLTAILSLLGIWFSIKGKRAGSLWRWLVLVCGIVLMAMAFQTGHSGGLI